MRIQDLVPVVLLLLLGKDKQLQSIPGTGTVIIGTIIIKLRGMLGVMTQIPLNLVRICSSIASMNKELPDGYK